MSNEASQNWIIYGAYGYTGELVVREAIAQQRKPVLAGRNEAKTRAVAEKYGLPYKVFNVNDASDHLQDIDILINCAGPFEQTAEPIMDACIKHNTHYFDITGEISVYQAAHSRHEQASKAGISAAGRSTSKMAPGPSETRLAPVKRRESVIRT
jgi:short subunit dehydrogenase-like uncharacterized protein